MQSWQKTHVFIDHLRLKVLYAVIETATMLIFIVEIDQTQQKVNSLRKLIYSTLAQKTLYDNKNTQKKEVRIQACSF